MPKCYAQSDPDGGRLEKSELNQNGSLYPQIYLIPIILTNLKLCGRVAPYLKDCQMSKVCMAAVNDNDRTTFTLGRLRERFPEIPEGVISKIHAQVSTTLLNLIQESCLFEVLDSKIRYMPTFWVSLVRKHSFSAKLTLV